jgi:glucan phosphoethanolaminetransferase (alkaline phosphatase superfamily)
MKTPSVAVVLLLARAMVVAGHHVPLSAWTLIAFFWQDAAVVLAFATFELWLWRHPRFVSVAYALVVMYVAINIPVARVLATPLTWSMWRAAGAALSDSIALYVTWSYLSLAVSVLIVALMAPLVLRPVLPRTLLAMLALSAALGPMAVARVDTRGLERNAWVALIGTSIQRLHAVSPPSGVWDAAGFDRTRSDDLSHVARTAAGRNIVLVSLESTAARYLGIYGASPDPMPNLSALARTSIVFENAYAAYPESIKGLFSILCSTYPALDSDAAIYAHVPCRSLAAVLSGHGYRTALFHSGRFMYLGMEAIVGNRGYDLLLDAGDIGGHHNSSFGVDEPSTVSRILQWIDGIPRGQRFFVTYLPIAGHHPYEVPEPGPFTDADEFGRYRNALHYGDASIAALARGLAERGLDRKTVWIVFGDHGEAFGQHDGNYGHTFFLYDENVHVPFIIAAPGLFSDQTRIRRVVSLVDTAPTVFDLFGIQSPETYQGRSMLSADPRMALFFADYSMGLLGLRDGPMKFIYERDAHRTKLYNIDSDPQETIDLSGRQPAHTAWYAQNLRNWSAAQKRLIERRQ